ncbi:hypothetical protein ACOMHN_032648 [Nucella lapillus]
MTSSSTSGASYVPCTSCSPSSPSSSSSPTLHSLPSPLTVRPPYLLLLLTLLLAHVSLASSKPIFLQRRQSFFRCTGWGAGCSNLDYTAAYSRAEPRGYTATRVPVVRSRARNRAAATTRGGGGGVRGGKGRGGAGGGGGGGGGGWSRGAAAFSPGWGSRNRYGLHFLFTSGTSWGANGKRSAPSLTSSHPHPHPHPHPPASRSSTAALVHTMMQGTVL